MEVELLVVDVGHVAEQRGALEHEVGVGLVPLLDRVLHDRRGLELSRQRALRGDLVDGVGVLDLRERPLPPVAPQPVQPVERDDRQRLRPALGEVTLPGGDLADEDLLGAADVAEVDPQLVADLEVSLGAREHPEVVAELEVRHRGPVDRLVDGDRDHPLEHLVADQGAVVVDPEVGLVLEEDHRP